LLKYATSGGAALLCGESLSATATPGSGKGHQTQPVVATTHGRVRGYTAGPVSIFKGIPYGASPTGESRFLPPRQAVAWSGVRNATHYGPMAMQRPMTDETYLRVLRGLYPLLPYPMSEDCLFLNVWSPELGALSRRPVMVWLHPGGNTVGAGNSPWSDGTHLARRHEVVVVTLNHRLGVFGNLYLGDIGGSKYAESGNAGLLDIVAALAWVQDNIEQFGGDPDNVTVFGESGGAGKVSALMAMPPARGLFHKSIVQSGSWIRAALPQEASKSAAALVRRLGLEPHQVDRLHHLPARALLEAMGDFVWPVLAGTALPRHLFDPDAPPTTAEVPMLIGNTRNEAIYYTLNSPLPPMIDDAALCKNLVESVGWEGVDDDEAAACVDAYRSVHPNASNEAIFFGIGTYLACDDAIIQADRKAARAAAPVYMYLFEWEAPAFGGQYGSCHTFDVPFVFENLSAARQLWGPIPDPRGDELAANISKSWATFAHTGNPNHSGLPPWRPYTAAARETMVLNYASKLVRDPWRAERLAFEPLRSSRLSRVNKLKPS